MLQFAAYYHIFNHANGDDNLFREEKNYDFFLKKYHQHIDPIAETIAWCLMPNHFHLLLKIKGEQAIASTFPKFKTLEKLEDRSRFISKQFSNFFSSYTQAYNKAYQRRGSLFIKNFKRKVITSEHYLSQLILYIHLNPVKHGFVPDFEEWKHASFHCFPKLNPKLMEWVFGTQKDYIEMHQVRKKIFKDYQKLEDELT